MIGVGGGAAPAQFSPRVRRRRTRPPESSARPPSRTGIAAKPVNGSWLVWAAAAAWRVGCVPELVSSAGRTPETLPVSGASAGETVVSVLGAFSASAGTAPPSPQVSDGLILPLSGGGVGVVVHTGVGVGVGVWYCEMAALDPDWAEPPPEIARPAPAVLNSIPETNRPRMAMRDFMDWLLLRERSAARRRTRCLI